jgi:hypothetical protein
LNDDPETCMILQKFQKLAPYVSKKLSNSIEKIVSSTMTLTYHSVDNYEQYSLKYIGM